MYANNPKYQLLFSHGKNHVYFLNDANLHDLHKSREVDAGIQNTYSGSGANAQYIEQLADAAIAMLENDAKSETLRQNQMALWQQLKYRTKYPVDNLCAIRMGAILSFMEVVDDAGNVLASEPEPSDLAWLNKKVQLALEVPDAYNFFLTWGLANTPSYFSHLSILEDKDYFIKRAQRIASLTPLVNKLTTSTQTSA